MRFFLVLVLFSLAATLTAADAVTASKEWTFMVFLNADNNLDSFGVGDLDEMEEAGSNDKVNIIVELDRYSGPSKRFFVKKGSSDVVADLGEVDMGDYKHFVEFVKWGVDNYPAKKYCVVVWNHGSGWNKQNGVSLFKGISYDDSSDNHITTNQLTTATAQIKKLLGRKLDILAFDACLMGMAEVDYAIKDNVDIIVSSEETEPGEGWPYNDMLKPLVKSPAMAKEALASLLVKKYAASYDGGSQGRSDSTQGAVNLTKFDNFIEKLNAFCDAQMGKNTAEITSVLSKVQKFYYKSNINFIHFLELLKDAVKDRNELAANQIDTLLTATQETIIESGYSGYKMKNAKGLAIYFPAASYSFSSRYADLGWAKDTKWDEFVKAYYSMNNIAQVIEAAQHGDTSVLKAFLKNASEIEKRELVKAINSEIHLNRSIVDTAVISEIQGLVK